MTPQDVARYLEENPDFFASNEELLAGLTLPHPQEGGAISLTERQLLTLRDKIRQLERKLAELLRFGEENDQISEKVHRLALALIEANDYDLLRENVHSHLREDFLVPQVALRIWNCVLSRDNEDFATVSDDTRMYAGNLRQPYCGLPGESEVLGWFGENGAEVRSIALVPLRVNAQTFGLLALGSPEPERFFAGMGTLYLERIGDMIATALQRRLG